MPITINDVKFLNKKEINKLEVISKFSSLQSAGEYLGLSRTALTNFLKKMEIQFDVNLIARDGHSLTPECLKIISRSKSILQEIDTFKLEMGSFKNFNPVQSGAINLATFETIESVLMPLFYKTVKLRAPNLTFNNSSVEVNPNTSTQDIQKVKDKLQDGSLDIALVYLLPNKEASSLKSGGASFDITTLQNGNFYSRPLYEEMTCCMVNKSIKKESLNIEEYLLMKHVVIDPKHNDQQIPGRTKRKVGIVAANWASLALFIEKNSELICTPPDIWARSVAKNCDVKIIRAPSELTQLKPICSMIWHERTNNSPTHRVVREAFKESAKKINERAREERLKTF